MKKKVLIGLLQACGVVAYTVLVSCLFSFLNNNFSNEPDQFWAPIIMLSLLVFSVAITGLIVFGYPAYLALNKRIKDALTVLAFTIIFGIIIIAITLVIVYIV